MIHTAPLAKISTRQWMKMMRLLSKSAVLWSEMLNVNAINNGDLEQLARRHFRPEEDTDGSCVLQLASSEPNDIAAAISALRRSRFFSFFDEVNLNCGCPAPSAGAGAFGAVLMRQSERSRVLSVVEELVRAVGAEKQVSIKIRTGIVGESSYERLTEFVSQLANCGVGHIVLHARDAILDKELTPKENLKVPPLKRDWALQLLKDVRAPGLRVTYNGEVRTLDEARELLTAGLFDGVMMGRALIDDPFKLAFADSNEDLETRENVARLYAEWLETGKNAATNAESANMNPMLNLFHGHPKSKLWKRILLEDREQPSSQRIRRALEKIV